MGLDLLQEGKHTGPVLQVSGQCGILYFEEGLWEQAANTVLISRMLEEGCGQDSLTEVSAINSLLYWRSPDSKAMDSKVHISMRDKLSE